MGQALAAVVQDAAAREHAAGGDDDRRTLEAIERLRFLARAAHAHPLVHEQAAPADVPQAGRVPLGVGAVDPRGLDGHGAVQVDGEGPHASLLDQRVHEHQHLLGAPDGEGRDDQDAAAVERAQEHALQLVQDGDGRVRAVAVGALHHHVVGGGGQIGVVGEHRPEAPSRTVSTTEAAPSRWPASRKRNANAAERSRSWPSGTIWKRLSACSTSASS